MDKIGGGWIKQEIKFETKLTDGRKTLNWTSKEKKVDYKFNLIKSFISRVVNK